MSSKNGKTPRETIPLGLIARSPANPRKTFDEAALAELAESIQRHGVLQPIVVRPIVQRVTRGPLKGASECYELVAGERRVRAAERAGLTEIPATIRELTDQEADQIRLVENDQRADLSPIERADAYGIYLQQHGATVEDLAAAVGKSTSTIRNILRLRNVPQEIRFAVEDGRISASTAGLIARVPGRYHRDTVALCVLKGIQWHDARSFRTQNFSKMIENAEPLSYRDTKDLIAKCCTRELKQAQFSRQRLDLVPQGVSCDACPKRAGNDPDLVAEGVRADVCTDPDCFEQRTGAWQQEQIRLAGEKGQEVLSGKAAGKVFGYHGQVRDDSGYVDLMDQPYQDRKRRSIKQLLGKHLEEKDVVLAVDDRGQLHRLVSRKVADPILKKEHKLDLGSYRSTTAPLTAAEKKRRQQAIEEGKVRQAETRAILAAAHRAAVDVFGLALPGGPDTGTAALLRHLVADRIEQSWGSVLEDLCDRRGLKGRMDERREALQAQVREMDGPELMGLLVEILADRKIIYETEDDGLARDLGLDVAKIRQQAAADLKAGVGTGTPLAQVLAPQANGKHSPPVHPGDRSIEDLGLPDPVVARLRQNAFGTVQEILAFVDADDLNKYGSLEKALDQTAFAGMAGVVVAGIRLAFADSGLRHCRECFCTEDRACLGADDEPCHWVEDDLCSSCAEAEPVVVAPATKSKKRARK